MELAIEVRALDAEGVGRSADVAGEVAQTSEDELLFERVASLLECRVGRDLSRRSSACSELDIFRLDRIAAQENRQPLDHIAELANVSRPVVSLQLRRRAARQPLPRSAGLGREAAKEMFGEQDNVVSSRA